ncbi:hypothetical protein GY45DRAFT_1254173, partial [Cubamyces sp. BRFM 1775]
MSHPYRLPARGAAGAPHFDPAHPHSLLDFFEDLEYMLEEAAVDDEQKRKEHAIRYAPGEHKLLWRSFPSHKEGRSYEDFKKEVIKEYLGDDGKRLYSLGDLKVLVAEAARAGFRSSSEFKAYSRNFRIVADYLVTHEVLRDDERDRLFLKGIPAAFASRVLDRLRIKHPDVLAPRQPYSVAQVSEAAEFVLDSQDEDAPVAQASGRVADVVSTRPKTEQSEIANALAAMAQAVSLLQQRAPPSTGSTAGARQPPPHLDLVSTAPRSNSCHYCGDEGHIIRRCPQVEADINAGLIKRNDGGQVVLTSGSYVPSTITGPNLRSRVQEYYRHHP